jgi:hypothetical protein
MNAIFLSRDEMNILGITEICNSAPISDLKYVIAFNSNIKGYTDYEFNSYITECKILLRKHKLHKIK